MGFAAVIDESLVQKFQQNYRHAFRVFVEATDELLHLQDDESVNLSQIQQANVRIRNAQEACREARDKLACLLLESRRQKLLCSAASCPAQIELVRFITSVTALLTNDKSMRAAGPLHTSRDIRLPNLERGGNLSIQA